LISDARPATASALPSEHSGDVTAVAFSPDNKLLASGSNDKTVGIWDLINGKPNTLVGHTAFVKCVAFSPDGELLASAGDDNAIKLWNVKTGMSEKNGRWRKPIARSLNATELSSFNPSAARKGFALRRCRIN
jgi:WD40 repeat protein